MHNALVEAILASRCHVIVTMRTKTDYLHERDERTGKTVIRKVGLAPIQKSEMEYEFDVAADMDLDHNLIVSKTRCPALDGVVINRPGAEFAATVRAWLMDGTPADGSAESRQASVAQPPPVPVPTPPPAPPPPRPTPAPRKASGHGNGNGGGANSGGNGGAFRQGIEALIARYAAAQNLEALDALDAHVAGLPRPIREAPQVQGAARQARQILTAQTAATADAGPQEVAA